MRGIVLLSGGLDSTTCLGVAKNECEHVYTMSFDYGQRHKLELERSAMISKKYGADKHKLVRLDIADLLESALTNHNIEVPDFEEGEEIPITYVPARNTIFLSIALGWAESLDADHIYIGVSEIDYSGYPDCRPEYIAKYNELILLATKKGVTGRAITIKSPLANLNKADTIKLGIENGIDYADTISCYSISPEGKACGKCDSCEYRRRGFSEAGVEDPTVYL